MGHERLHLGEAPPTVEQEVLAPSREGEERIEEGHDRRAGPRRLEDTKPRAEQASRGASPDRHPEPRPARGGEAPVARHHLARRRGPFGKPAHVDEAATERSLDRRSVMPRVREGRLRRPLADQGEALGQAVDRDALDRGRPAGHRLQPQGRGEDDPRETVAAAGHLEELGLVLPIEAQGAESGVKEREVHHGAPEGPLEIGVLPVDVPGDAPAHRDRGIAGLDGQDEPSRRGERQELLEPRPGLDLDEPLLGLEAEHPVEAGHVQDQAAGPEARGRVGIAAAAGDHVAVAERRLDHAVAVGAAEGRPLDEAAVERVERGDLGSGRRCGCALRHGWVRSSDGA